MNNQTQAYHFAVTGMSCQGCVKAVERLILKQDPAAKADVNLERAEAVITSRHPAQLFSDALTKAGYPATIR